MRETSRDSPPGLAWRGWAYAGPGEPGCCARRLQAHWKGRGLHSRQAAEQNSDSVYECLVNIHPVTLTQSAIVSVALT